MPSRQRPAPEDLIRAVYAGFLEHVDHHLGQLVDGLADLEILDNSLIY